MIGQTRSPGGKAGETIGTVAEENDQFRQGVNNEKSYRPTDVGSNRGARCDRDGIIACAGSGLLGRHHVRR
jgi:hypothetical protein